MIKNWANLLACTLAFRAALKPCLLPFPDHWSHDAWITLIGYVFCSVRQTEALARKYAGQKPAYKRRSGPSANVTDVERRLRESLGTKVSLKHGKKGGTVTIYYYSDEDLETLLGKLT